MPQYESIPLVREEVVARAVSLVGTGVYELGCGGRNPAAASPFAASRRGRPGRVYVDCTGFTSWCLGHDRVQDLGEDTETWYDTAGVFNDAQAKPYLMYAPIPRDEQVLVGDVIVYPDSKTRKQGHIGIITRVDSRFKRLAKGWPDLLDITHASTGGRVAVRTSTARLWAERGGSILRYIHMED